jgi:hypothetical protein
VRNETCFNSFLGFLQPTPPQQKSFCDGFRITFVSSVGHVEIFQYSKQGKAAKTILATAKFAVEATATGKSSLTTTTNLALSWEDDGC